MCWVSLRACIKIESACENLTAAQRCAARQAQALPLLRSLETWLAQESPRLLPKSPIGKAALYTTNQWQALLRYTEDGELSIDNNVSERTVKIQAISRKNWLFVASVNGGQRAATLYSLIASCKANQVEPWAYLRDVFTRLPALPADDPELLDQLLPDRWLQAHPPAPLEHRRDPPKRTPKASPETTPTTEEVGVRLAGRSRRIHP